MATQYNSIIRLKKIDECLKNRSKVYNLDQLIEAIKDELEKFGKQVKVSERTIYDDLKFLKEEFGPFSAPIERNNEKGYFYKESGYSVFNPSVNSDNIKKIQASLSTLSQVANLKGFEDLQEILLRLEANYNFDNDQRIDPIVFLEEGLNIVGQKYIEPLKQNINNQETLSISYKPFDKPAYSRVISPYFLKEYNNRWFLIGHQHSIQENDYSGLTNVPLDRIEGVKSSLAEFISKGDLDVRSYFKNVIGVTINNEEKVDVVFKVFGHRRHYVQTKKIHHSQTTLQMTDTFGLFSIAIIPNNELVSHLLEFGSDLEVIGPPNIRDKMIEIVTGMSNRYV